MQANYPTPILNFTLAWEGGFVNNPHDPGGATMHGITQRTYDAWRKAHGLPAQFVSYIAESELADIYRTGYWNYVRGDSLPVGVDLLGFDVAVNSGPNEANLLLVQTQTLGLAQRIAEIDKLRRNFWAHLLSFRWFGQGWFARENAALVLARQMAGIKAEPERWTMQISPKIHMIVAVIMAVLIILAKGSIALPMGIPPDAAAYITSWSNFIIAIYAAIAPLVFAGYSSNEPGPFAPQDPPVVKSAKEVAALPPNATPAQIVSVKAAAKLSVDNHQP